MCETSAFLLTDGKEEKIVENVELVESDGSQIKITDLFGEQKTLKARFKTFDSTKGRIIFEAVH